MLGLTQKVVIAGDTHFPFHNQKALMATYDIISEVKPDMVIQMGDLYDMFSYSKYARGMNLTTPQEECTRARQAAESFWKECRKRAPKAKLVQLTGNHDERIVKNALYKSPENEHVAKSYLDSLMTFDNVKTVNDTKEEFFYDGVCYQHGFRKFGEHAVFNQMNTICGHLHRGALQFNENVHGSFFELNVGWLGDKRSPVFSYRSQNKISKTTLGCGVIDKYGPRFVCFE